VKKPSPKSDQLLHTPSETDSAVIDGRHWLKYAGIGGRRQKHPGAGPASGEEVTSLGSLEAELLGLLWEIGRPATGMEVMEASLYRRRAQGQEPAAFATIATTLRRLNDKGLLESHKNDARTSLYWPTVGREQMAARILNNVSQTLLGTSLHSLLPKLIGRVKTQTGQTSVDQNEEEQEVLRLMQALEQAAEASGTRIPGKGTRTPDD
jgi:predicted transcriptional regulator